MFALVSIFSEALCHGHLDNSPALAKLFDEIAQFLRVVDASTVRFAFGNALQDGCTDESVVAAEVLRCFFEEVLCAVLVILDADVAFHSGSRDAEFEGDDCWSSRRGVWV